MVLELRSRISAGRDGSLVGKVCDLKLAVTLLPLAYLCRPLAGGEGRVARGQIEFRHGVAWDEGSHSREEWLG